MFHFPNFLTNQTDYTSTKISKILSTTHFSISGPSIKKIFFSKEEDDDDKLLRQWCEQNHDKSATNLERKDLSALAYAMPMRECAFVWERISERRRWWLAVAMDSDCTEREREREARVLNLMRKRGARLWDERGIRVLKYAWQFCIYNLLVWIIFSIQ